ncbi:hypothetical protein EB796_021862 [Bugula neritina]|uniref:Uncharacterized protein n=1 Tax=Bugula neritina TaxID=10212 RepID=A0A7J7J139_BUGNE|nr:hypothetical protein EB796_021862 [Bugula neritina]
MSSAGFTTPGKNKTPQLMNAIHLSHGQGTPVYKRPMSYTPVKPLPTRKELLSKELGLNYESDGPHSNSSEDGPGDMTQVDSPSVRIVKYNALKKQMKTMSEERESLLLKISKLREQLKLQKKQIETEESDRKNQLHIMKNTYEQASSDKNRVIGLFESVVREQECELEELRKISDTRGLGTCVDFPNSQGGTAISRLTAQLNQVIQEKNDILAQFCSQQVPHQGAAGGGEGAAAV